MNIDKDLQQNIDAAKKQVPQSGKTSIEDITESIDNSPIWPDEQELKENEQKQGHDSASENNNQ